MSWETLLIGDIYFKRNYKKIEGLLEEICEILELRKPIKIRESEYEKLRRSGNAKYGNYLVSSRDFLYLLITDINWGSHVNDEKLEELRSLLSKNKDLVDTADLSLFYLDEAHETLNYDSSRDNVSEENEEDVEDVE
jgi:hypothetical protein